MGVLARIFAGCKVLSPLARLLFLNKNGRRRQEEIRSVPYLNFQNLTGLTNGLLLQFQFINYLLTADADN